MAGQPIPADLRAWMIAMRDIGRELSARTCNDRNPLVRFARVQPITGHPVAGWCGADVAALR